MSKSIDFTQSFFVSEAQEQYRIKRIPSIPTDFSKSILKKVRITCDYLAATALKLNLPTQFLISYYLYYLFFKMECNNLNLCYLKLSEFKAKAELETIPKYTEEEVLLSFTLRHTWNKMCYRTEVLSHLPQNVRNVLVHRNVELLVNTFFPESSDILIFCKLSRLIIQNRLNYPRMHGYFEFFISQPVLRGPGTYLPTFYDNLAYLEKYYTRVYGWGIRGARYQRFKQLAEVMKDNQCIPSDLWCSEQLRKDLHAVPV